ncbi:Enolase-phosphatase E1 [Alphaproteobacteria bacterium SO-S41]|nr:Enolase-phosphatase E1 [Alphaproteobacteria bacterium SO-S41]
MTIRAVLLDIEGTTAPISFVAKTLFPYAAARLADFVRANAADPEIAGALKETAELEGRALSTDEAIDVLLGWIKADRKATPLKTLQGKVWRQGYESGAIRSPVYPDAVAAMRAWKARGLRLDVYSSGSVEAQVLLYKYSQDGDLTPLFDAYFDTRTGPKMEAASYTKIAAEIGHAPADILFLSDLPRENEAALAAGLKTVRIDRNLAPGTSQVEDSGLRVAADFTVVEQQLA